uniref:UvrABC system protein C n=1 Tax=Leptospirillum ferriphilum TaxID=178606 RepID=A0A7C3QQU5_9BACT
MPDQENPPQPQQPSTLEERLRSLPEEPGVYLMKNAEDEILYVGKSRSLKDRVRSYFQNSRPRSGRIAMLVSRVWDIEIIRTKSELDALILENTLIKRYHPRYNVLLRDDKTYPYLKLSWNDPYPRLTVTRKVRDDGSLYFGPYPNPSALKDTIRLIRKTFPLATCSISLDKPTLERPCVEYQIKRCLGPCVKGLTSESEYRQVATGVKLFLQGKSESLLSFLENEMSRQAMALEFEKAAMTRNRYLNVLQVMEKHAVSFPFFHPIDGLYMMRSGPSALVMILHIRNGLLIGKKEVELKNVEDATDEEILVAFLEQFYGKESSFLPAEILIPLSLSEDEFMSFSWMSEKKGEEQVRIIFPKRGDKKMILDLARENAEEALKARKSRNNDPEPILEELQKFLNLEDLPRIICCVDISNTGDLFPVASLVTFRDGKPDKELYRKFRIRYEKGQDDFKMLSEVMERQFKEKSLPDLLVIDGGALQLGACVRTLASLGHTDARRKVVSLAKERTAKNKFERIFLPDQETPRLLPDHHPVKHLLVRLRDEAHRFALKYHRTLREEWLTRSRRRNVQGIDPAREKKLVQAFGSVKGVMEASPEDLMKAAGISRELANSIHLAIREQPPEHSETHAGGQA